MFQTLKQKIISVALNIGKNPQDNEEVRMLKRIWSITLLFASGAAQMDDQTLVIIKKTDRIFGR